MRSKPIPVLRPWVRDVIHLWPFAILTFALIVAVCRPVDELSYTIVIATSVSAAISLFRCGRCFGEISATSAALRYKESNVQIGHQDGEQTSRKAATPKVRKSKPVLSNEIEEAGTGHDS